MKKLIIMAAIFVAGIAANAASFKWSALNVYSSDGSTKWTGAVTLYAVGISDAIASTTASSGVVNYSFDTTATAVGSNYDFYFVVVDGDKTFTSATKNVGALDVGTANITFGNMASATQNASNWASSGGGESVPEPTSGLLMLIGAAGLALRRKHA